jgi:carboxypeptidase family protein
MNALRYFGATCVVTLCAAATVAGVQSPPSGIVAGRVVDATGAPVPAATVMLLAGPAPEAQVRGLPPDANEVLADDSGRFVFSNVPAGQFRIEANKPGWLPGAFGRRRPGGVGASFDLAEGARRNDLAITLYRAAVLGGRVADDTGDPLIGAEVRAVKQVFVAGRRQNDQPIRARTDDRGIYRFSNLLPGEYVVAVLATVLSEPPGFAGAVRGAEGLPQAYLQTMAATGSNPMVFDRATGVVGPDRALVGSLSTLARMPAADGAWPAYTTTYHPAATAQSGATVVKVQTGDSRTDIDVTVRLTSTFTVSGVVRDAEGPAVWNAVHLVPAETGDRKPLVDVATAVTDAKGAFTFYGVPAGRYIARVVRVPAPSGSRYGLVGGTGEILQVMAFGEGPPGAASVPTEPLFHADQAVVVSDRAIRDLVITMREGPRVRGRVRFEGKQPSTEEWQKAEVRLLPANGREDAVPADAPVSSDGRFTSASLWPGRYLIRATPPEGWHFKDATYQGRDVSSRPLEISADLDNVVVTFTDQARTITGSVQVEPGATAEEATVILFPADSTLWVDYGRTSRLMASARVPASAQFSLRLPPPGEYFIVAIPEDAVDQWQNPDVLSRLAALAERIRVSADAAPVQTLQLKRIR